MSSASTGHITEGDFSRAFRAEVDKWAECVTEAIDVADYTGLVRPVRFTDIRMVNKAAAGDMIAAQPDMPRVYSARITARKP